MEGLQDGENILFHVEKTNVSYHLFLADNTGRCVVVEWLDGEMCIRLIYGNLEKKDIT